jgi:hypothetical protein
MYVRIRGNVRTHVLMLGGCHCTAVVMPLCCNACEDFGIGRLPNRSAEREPCSNSGTGLCHDVCDILSRRGLAAQVPEGPTYGYACLMWVRAHARSHAHTHARTHVRLTVVGLIATHVGGRTVRTYVPWYVHTYVYVRAYARTHDCTSARPMCVFTLPCTGMFCDRLLPHVLAPRRRFVAGFLNE